MTDHLALQDKALRTNPPMMLLLADALSPKGAWCGPYAWDGCSRWRSIPGNPYLPDYGEWEPYARKLLDKKPA